jgi:hypothetical protein
MPYFFGFQRFNSARSASIPAASIFAQVAGVSRTVRCTRCSSGGFGGLPRGRFGSSMPRTVAPIYEDSNNPCNVDLSDYNKSMLTTTCKTCRQPIRPSAAYVRRLRLGGWAGMKHHLVAIGVIPSTDHDAPIEWQEAFCRAFGRQRFGGRNV